MFQMDGRYEKVVAINVPHAITKEDVGYFREVFGNNIRVNPGDKVRPNYKHYIGRMSHEMGLYAVSAFCCGKEGFDIEEGASLDENVKTMSKMKQAKCLLRIYVDPEDPDMKVYLDELEAIMANQKKMESLTVKIGEMGKGWILGESAEDPVAEGVPHKATLMYHAGYWSLVEEVMAWRDVGDSVVAVAWTHGPGSYYGGQLVVTETDRVDKHGRPMLNYAWADDHIRTHARFDWPIGYQAYGDESERLYLYTEKCLGWDGHLTCLKVTVVSKEQYESTAVIGGKSLKMPINLKAAMAAGQARAQARSETNSQGSSKTADAVCYGHKNKTVKREPRTVGQIAAEVNVDFKDIGALSVRINQVLRTEYPDQEIGERTKMREEIITLVLVDMAQSRINLCPKKQVLISQWETLTDRKVDVGRGWGMRSTMYLKKQLTNAKLRVERIIGREARELDSVTEEDDGGDSDTYDESHSDDSEPPAKAKRPASPVGSGDGRRDVKVVKKGVLIAKKKKKAVVASRKRGLAKRFAGTILPVIAVCLLGCFMLAFIVGLMLFMLKMYRDATRTFAAVGALAALGSSVAALTDDVGSPGWISTAGTMVKGVFRSAWNSGN